MSGKQKTAGVRRIWDKYKFVALVALAGAVLLLWPGGDGKTAERASPQAAALVEAALQQEMEDILGRIQGVGEVQVLLTVESDGERQLAQDSELSYSGSTAAPEDYSRSSQTVLVDDGSAEAPASRTPIFSAAKIPSILLKLGTHHFGVQHGHLRIESVRENSARRRRLFRLLGTARTGKNRSGRPVGKRLLVIGKRNVHT